MAMKIETKHYDISVILTLFNSKIFFHRALDSILKQSFKNYEIIIVDDGSSDNIEQELFPFLKISDNTKYIRHTNRKHPLSLNTGIINSSGKYISFLDSDDEYKENYLELRLKFLKNNPEIDLIYSPAQLIGEEIDFFVPDAKDDTKLIHLDQCKIGGTFFAAREIFEKLNGFKNVNFHDYEFYERAKRIFKIKEFKSRDYMYYRNNPDSFISRLKRVRNVH